MYLLSINVLLVLPAVVMSLVERVSCDFSFISLAIRVSSSTTLALSFSYFAINRINLNIKLIMLKSYH